jgi:hypothetical protein
MLVLEQQLATHPRVYTPGSPERCTPAAKHDEEFVAD